jgi:hypothetical protein
VSRLLLLLKSRKVKTRYRSAILSLDYFFLMEDNSELFEVSHYHNPPPRAITYTGCALEKIKPFCRFFLSSFFGRVRSHTDSFKAPASTSRRSVGAFNTTLRSRRFTFCGSNMNWRRIGRNDVRNQNRGEAKQGQQRPPNRLGLFGARGLGASLLLVTLHTAQESAGRTDGSHHCDS